MTPLCMSHASYLFSCCFFIEFVHLLSSLCRHIHPYEIWIFKIHETTLVNFFIDVLEYLFNFPLGYGMYDLIDLDSKTIILEITDSSTILIGRLGHTSTPNRMSL